LRHGLLVEEKNRDFKKRMEGDRDEKWTMIQEGVCFNGCSSF
jgi:hypothetical protein